MTTVRELMRVGLVTCPRSTTLGDAAALLVEHRVHALVVCDPGGSPAGILSDFDLLAGEWLAVDPESLAALREVTAGDLMSTPAETVEADTSVLELARRLRDEHIARLVVTDGGEAVGMVTTSDVVRHVASPPSRRECVADVMSQGIVVSRADVPVPAAARAMYERRSRSLVVLHADGTVSGVVTGTDLLAGADGSLADATVGSLMHPAVTIAADASLRRAADDMLRHEIHRLVVVDAQSMPLGIVSTSDIIAGMAAATSVWRDAPAL